MPPLFDPAWLVHADPALLVLEKPSGLLSQPGLGPDLSDSFITAVQSQWPEARLVHRLDRDTSGLMVVARSAVVHRHLSVAFADRLVEKRYVADVSGVPAHQEGWIDHPIAKRQHRPPLYGIDPSGKPCRTGWQLLDQHPGCSRLALQPLTGRSHQLRVHLQALGHPILGDPLYGVMPAPRLHLHACSLGFSHPGDGRWMAFESSVPFALP
ncbi:RluA family pseudouridine synthase [Synechococcus sp. W4D4]|uniref:RluA family pseudouridine synthase n=1 Tax=Synechococcus sp. W4D4 TaxID=3392294 RepID=UPI0039E811AD